MNLKFLLEILASMCEKKLTQTFESVVEFTIYLINASSNTNSTIQPVIANAMNNSCITIEPCCRKFTRGAPVICFDIGGNNTVVYKVTNFPATPLEPQRLAERIH